MKPTYYFRVLFYLKDFIEYMPIWSSTLK